MKKSQNFKEEDYTCYLHTYLFINIIKKNLYNNKNASLKMSQLF